MLLIRREFSMSSQAAFQGSMMQRHPAGMRPLPSGFGGTASQEDDLCITGHASDEAQGELTLMRPKASSNEPIEQILDWDMRPGGLPGGETMLLPTSSAVLAIAYGVSLPGTGMKREAKQRFMVKGRFCGASGAVRRLPESRGGGVIYARLRPGMVGTPAALALHGGEDGVLTLDQLFGAASLAVLAEELAAAPSAAQRGLVVQQFLRSALPPRSGLAPMARAARGLQARPDIAIHDMAHHCRLSERHFFRRFSLDIGLGPKHFARLARMELALASWRMGASWAEAAVTGGYADQAHLVRDFKRMTGTPPERLLRSGASRRGHAFNALLAASCFANVFPEATGLAH
jgi:AraC-like DNA-binding protein